jgi:hypothetical protein
MKVDLAESKKAKDSLYRGVAGALLSFLFFSYPKKNQ